MRASLLTPDIRYRARFRGGLAGEVVQRVIDHVRANLSEPLSLEVLAEVAGLSRFHFARQFRVSTGESPMGYVLRARMERARVLLSRPEHPTIAHIASSLGFADQSHFTRTFRRFFGLTPKTFASLAGTPASGGPEPEVEALLAVG